MLSGSGLYRSCVGLPSGYSLVNVGETSEYPRGMVKVSCPEIAIINTQMAYLNWPSVGAENTLSAPKYNFT